MSFLSHIPSAQVQSYLLGELVAALLEHLPFLQLSAQHEPVASASSLAYFQACICVPASEAVWLQENTY